MATDSKRLRQGSKRTASGSLITTEHASDQGFQWNIDLADDYNFLAPNEICQNAIGLFFCLTTKRLLSISFSNLYHRSQKRDWMDLLTRERRSLKPNINSIEKCFMLNRLIAECVKNPDGFIQHLAKLYEEIKTRMFSRITSFSTEENLYDEIQTYRNLQCQQRLFHINVDETRQSQTLLGLQQATTKLCCQLISSREMNTNYLQTEGCNHLRKLIQHSFIIVAQPSTAECVAATKYEKCGNTYIVKLHSRILCLLDADKIETYFTLSNVGVTLYSLDRQVGEAGEIQSGLEWKTKRIFDAEGVPTLFYYAELQSIRLTKPDARSSRPWYNSKLCQLQFQLKIRINHLNIEDDMIFLSRPFGLCSHSQYFPAYIAKVLIYEIEQIPQTIGYIIPPNIVTDFICRYHTRIAGVEPQLHTRQFILQQLQIVYEANKDHLHITSVDIYQEILAKLISQIEFFVDHPFLSMMYYDNYSLFLGICNSEIDKEIHGTPEQPHILLRFDSLAEHPSTHQASVRYIVHNGQLIKASFHTKAFVDDMCRMVCESNSEKAKVSRILSDIPNRSFHDFILYFDNELYRLSFIASSTKEGYKPLIPVLWSTMRLTTNDQSKQVPSSPSFDGESATSCSSSLSQMQTSSSDVAITTNSPMSVNEKITLQTDKLIHYLTERLPEMFMKFGIENSALNSCSTVNTPTLSLIPTDEIMKQRKLLLSNLLYDYLQTISQVQASTPLIHERNDTKSYTSYCSTSTNT